MTIILKKQFAEIIEQHPNGGIVFAELDSSYNPGEIMVTDGEFGATCLVPHEGEVFDLDWNIKECFDDDTFAIYDHTDILQMIQTLTKSLELRLKYT